MPLSVPAAAAAAAAAAAKWLVFEPRVEHVTGDFAFTVRARALVFPASNPAILIHNAVLVLKFVTLVDFKSRLPLWEPFTIHLDGFLQSSPRQRRGDAGSVQRRRESALLDSQVPTFQFPSALPPPTMPTHSPMLVWSHVVDTSSRPPPRSVSLFALPQEIAHGGAGAGTGSSFKGLAALYWESHTLRPASGLAWRMAAAPRSTQAHQPHRPESAPDARNETPAAACTVATATTVTMKATRVPIAASRAGGGEQRGLGEPLQCKKKDVGVLRLPGKRGKKKKRCAWQIH